MTLGVSGPPTRTLTSESVVNGVPTENTKV